MTGVPQKTVESSVVGASAIGVTLLTIESNFWLICLFKGCTCQWFHYPDMSVKVESTFEVANPNSGPVLLITLSIQVFC